jgi:hypothetical protein
LKWALTEMISKNEGGLQEDASRVDVEEKKKKSRKTFTVKVPIRVRACACLV